LIQEEGDGISPEDLASKTVLSEDQVRAECGQLIREGEIRFTRREGNVVYVPMVAS
jgi:hypothetical protein